MGGDDGDVLNWSPVDGIDDLLYADILCDNGLAVKCIEFENLCIDVDVDDKEWLTMPDDEVYIDNADKNDVDTENVARLGWASFMFVVFSARI